MNERWIRSGRASVADCGNRLVLLSRDGSVVRLDGDSAELARVVIGLFGRPRDEAEVIAHVEGLAGPLGERRHVVAQLIGLLRETGAVVAADEPSVAANPLRVVVAISGAIAASHAPALVGGLLRRRHRVEVALTATAARFVSVDALAALTQREPQLSLWPRAAHLPVPHIALAHWAQLVIVYPASATTVGRIANGDFSDLVAATALTTRAPVVIVPSMNADMLESHAVQRSLERLRDDGFVVLHGVPSHEVADAPELRASIGGGAPAPAETIAAVEALLRSGALQPRRDDAWDEAYRAARLPWVTAECDADLAAALAAHAPPPRLLLDVGCGLGQITRHAARAGYRCVASDIAETALLFAGAQLRDADSVVCVRDDICASALVGPFGVIVDRATLHALPPTCVPAYAASMRRLLAPGGILIIKAHRDDVPGVTRGWNAAALSTLWPEMTLLDERAAELPGIADAAPIPSVLVVLQRRR